MRIVASFAVLLLLLAFAVDLESRSKSAHAERVIEEENRADHTIRVYSSGWRLDPARLGSRNRDRGIFVDEEWYNVGTQPTGLRVVSIPPNGGPISIVNFDLAANDAEVNRFATLLAGAPVNTVLAMGAFRALAPRGKTEPERRAKMGMLFRGLGMRSTPEEKAVSSLAFICVRRPQGFVPLAERYSTTRGVSLSFHLNRDLSVYDDHVLSTSIDNRRTIKLAPNQAQGEKLTVEGGRRLSEVDYPALRANSTWVDPARITWHVDPDADPAAFPNVSLGGLTPITFSAAIALHWNPSETLKSVRFVLRINGREMGRRSIVRDGGEDMRWLAWEELIAPDIERIEKVEISIERMGVEGPTAVAYIANATLRSGSVTSP